MKLVMNLPTTTEGKKEFNEQFSKLQAHLVMKCIKDLKTDDTSKKNIASGILNTLADKKGSLEDGK